MKLGLLTDIHEDHQNLKLALDHFAQEKVDQVVVIGDLFRLGKEIEDTCRLLCRANAMGVWGNHDYGACHQSAENLQAEYGPATAQFLSLLDPNLELGECHFCHVEPWLNPEEIFDLWFFDGPPETGERVDKIFRAVHQRLLFSGHYHKWLALTPAGLMNWVGNQPLEFSPHERYFVVIGALCEGKYAILDTKRGILFPFQISGNLARQ